MTRRIVLRGTATSEDWPAGELFAWVDLTDEDLDTCIKQIEVVSKMKDEHPALSLYRHEFGCWWPQWFSPGAQEMTSEAADELEEILDVDDASWNWKLMPPDFSPPANSLIRTNCNTISVAPGIVHGALWFECCLKNTGIDMQTRPLSLDELLKLREPTDVEAKV